MLQAPSPHPHRLAASLATAEGGGSGGARGTGDTDVTGVTDVTRDTDVTRLAIAMPAQTANRGAFGGGEGGVYKFRCAVSQGVVWGSGIPI